MLLLEGGDLQPVFQSLGDGLLGVNMLAGFRYLVRQRQVLLVGDGQDYALDLGIRQGISCPAPPGRPTPSRMRRVFPRSGYSRDDPKLVGLLRGARQHLGPATQADDAHLHGERAHQAIPEIHQTQFYSGERREGVECRGMSVE